jgi:hypothetical protein
MPSIAMKHLLPMGLALVSALSLCQCANSDPKRVADQAAPRVEWYLASKDPPTYCPVGHALPQRGSAEEARAEYITVPGRPTRYYIPPGCVADRQLALRLARPPGPGFCQSATETGIASIEEVAKVVVTVASIPMWVRVKMSEANAERDREVSQKFEQRQARRIAAEKPAKAFERFKRSRPALEPSTRNSER